jgi:multiple sugar transport system substrate-binding protein
MLLAACGGAGSASDQAAEIEGARGIKLEYWSVNPPTTANGAAFEKIHDSFNRQNTHGITVQTASAATDLEKLIGALAAGTPPDLTRFQTFNLSSLYAKGGLVDVDAVMKGIGEWRKVRESLYPNIVRGLSWKGKLFGVPTFAGGQLLYYSPAVLQRAGLAAPPRLWTWEQFEDTARKASRPQTCGGTSRDGSTPTSATSC